MFYSPVAMHIPDGFLSIVVSIILWVLSAGAIGIALRQVNRNFNERDIPLMGVLAAAIFAGQMLNFSVTGGTSGHLMGAALATILLGPWAAVIVMTSVVSVQALIFQDGGLLALGGNLFNMSVIGVAVSYAAYRIVNRVANGKPWGIFSGGFIAAWLSIVLSALAVALQLALSGTSPANIAIPAMGAIHALIGVGEGLITVGSLAFIYAARKDLLKVGQSQSNGRAVWIGGLLIAMALAVASPLASANPDGLEWVAEQQNFIGAAQGSIFNIIPDYILPGINNPALATILAGVLGIVIVVAAVMIVTLSKRRSTHSG